LLNIPVEVQVIVASNTNIVPEQSLSLNQLFF